MLLTMPITSTTVLKARNAPDRALIAVATDVTAWKARNPAATAGRTSASVCRTSGSTESSAPERMSSASESADAAASIAS